MLALIVLNLFSTLKVLFFSTIVFRVYNDNQYDNNHGHNVIPISCLQYGGETKYNFGV